MTSAPQPFRWRSIMLPAVLPTVLFMIGEGALIPVIPIVADSLGATLAVAGLVAALLTMGELVGNIPSGWLVARVGERPAMIGATALSMIGMVICILAPNPLALGFGILLVGLAAAVFALARHAFMTSFVPLEYRARALSTLGGATRLGVFVGPFITAGVIQLTGSAHTALWITVVACIATAIVLIALPDPTTTFGSVATVRLAGRRMREGEALAERESAGLFRTLHTHRRLLTRLGLGSAIVGAIRASRSVILPLWAVSIGVGDTQTALVMGIAGAIDFALFYPGGQLMDRFGRLWGALPSMIGISAGHLILAFTHDVPAAVTWWIAAALIISAANGLGSGVIMTIGADLADRSNPAPFLGAWRFTNNLGGASAPLLIAAVTGVASISLAAGAVGAIGLFGAAVLARYVPRYLSKRPGR